MPGKEENAGIVWRTLQGVYGGRLRSERGTRARVYVRAAPRNGLGGAEGAGKKADSGEPKTRGCGTGAGIYEQAGTRARTKERAEGAGGKLVWGCFAFLMGLKHVNATPSSRKTPFVDINRRYVRSVGRLTSFWKIWPGKMPAEARVNGFLRTRGLTYRRLLSTALCFSRRRVVEGQGGGKTAFRMLASRPVSRGRVTTSAIPLMCRGMMNHRHAVSVMPLTHHKPKCHVPCFLRRKSVGKGRVGG